MRQRRGGGAGRKERNNNPNIVFLLPQEAAASATPQSLNTSLDDHERRISHSLYGGLDGLDDNLMPRQGLMPRTVGKVNTSSVSTLI